MIGNRHSSRASRLTGVALLALTAITSACGVGWEDVQVTDVAVGEDGRTLLVWGHCHHDASVEVTETDDEVRVRLRGFEYRGDCLDSAPATLAAPLDGRPIVDEVTGEVVEPCDPADGDGLC